jgi:hypothetical protein
MNSFMKDQVQFKLQEILDLTPFSLILGFLVWAPTPALITDVASVYRDHV